MAESSGVAVYTVNHLLEKIMERCRAMKLRLKDSPRQTREAMLLMLMMHTIHVTHVGYPRIAV